MAKRDARLVRFPEGMLDDIAKELRYGESRNEWIVAVIRSHLAGRRQQSGTRLDDLLGPDEVAELAAEFPAPGVPTMDLLETCDGPGGPPVHKRRAAKPAVVDVTPIPKAGKS